MSEPTTPTGKRQHAGAWGDWEPEPGSAANGHSSDPADCSACRALAAIEREAAAAERERIKAAIDGSPGLWPIEGDEWCVPRSAIDRIIAAATGEDDDD